MQLSSSSFVLVAYLFCEAALQASAAGNLHGLRSTHTVLHEKESAKIGASVFDQLEKIAAHQQSSAFPSEVPTDSSSTMQGTMTVGSPMGAVGGVPQLGLNATQQAMMQMMQGLAVERIEMTPYGKTVPQEPGVRYIIASGQQECMQCEAIVAGAHFLGQSFDGICEFLGHGNMAVNSKMCHAQAHVLQSCPEFVNDWCYQDFGGSQMLRSPCPPYLICHYCLGLNPLHCQRNYLFPMPDMH